jgi:TATA-box binding protein (TBP) (component of TFIID and TFIIIB)
MLRIRLDNITILVFNNLKLRLMGRGNGHRLVFNEFLSNIPKVKVLSALQLMSFTGTYQFPHIINIQNLDPTYFYVDLETFPAAVLRHDGQENINVFLSGKIVITGLKQTSNFFHLIDKLQNHFSKK